MANRTCSIGGCGKPVYGRGWCGMHYQRWKRSGDPFHKAPTGGTCDIEGCVSPVLARGWCATHYRRWRLYGDPLTVKQMGAYAPDARCLADGCEERPASLG